MNLRRVIIDDGVVDDDHRDAEPHRLLGTWPRRPSR
jgi:hypothetical protein